MRGRMNDDGSYVIYAQRRERYIKDKTRHISSKQY